ncbi:hypothetical protein [Campylobacter devanensis]|uniref:hypothetical protein n=1 Tax=Campylobacter devanensis TaxID=3161138 RepID=UPI000A32D783|nr:hypothetical protein [Campylobacter sp. P093]
MDTKEIYDNQAYWYFDTKHYCTRITVEQKNDFNINYTSIADSVNSILAKNGKKLGGGGINAMNTIRKTMEVLISWLCFLEKIINSSLTFYKLKKIIKYTSYSLVKITKASILGFKIFKKIDFIVRKDFYIFSIRYFRINRCNGINKYYFIWHKTYFIQ